MLRLQFGLKTNLSRFVTIFVTIIPALMGFHSAAQNTHSSSAQILIVPDQDHADEVPRMRTANLLRELKKKNTGFNCLFLEWQKDAPIELYMNGISDYETFIKNEEKRVLDITKGYTYLMAPKFLLDAARESGFSVYGVNSELGSDLSLTEASFKASLLSYEGPADGGYEDAVKRAPRHLVESFMYLNQTVRNKAMSKEIDGRMKSGCRKGVFLIGADHLKTTEYGYKFISVQTQLRKLNYLVQVLK